MTHGFGGFSSGGGGGGGFSGGGGGGFHMHHMHHHHSGDDSDCECCCFFAICGINILGFIFCFRKMSRYVRIALLWAYVTIAVLTVGLLLSLSVFSASKFQAAPTDMRKADKKINNAFCQSVRFNSTDPFVAYSFDEAPVVDPNSVETFNTTYNMIGIGSNGYEYWGFYFLEGSTAVISTSGGDTVYVVKGSSNLQTWIDSEGNCVDCYIDKHDTPYTYHLEVSERDDYYFVYYTKDWFDTPFSSVYIRRTLFDVSRATSSCSFQKEGKPCQLDLSLNPGSNIVYHNGRSTKIDQSIDMWSSCQPRVWMYVMVFGLIPIPLTLILSFVFWKYCKDDRSQELSALSEAPDSPYNRF